MKAIHLIQKRSDLMPWPIEKGTAIYESGYWYVSIQKAEALIGKDIYFHVTQRSPSFLGGIIISYRVKKDAPWKGRIIFKFRADGDHDGIRTAKEGWARVKNYVE